MISTWLLQMAMNGLPQSPSLTPLARSKLRWAARASPRLIVSERMVRLSQGMHEGWFGANPILADASRPAKLWEQTQSGDRARSLNPSRTYDTTSRRERSRSRTERADGIGEA